MIHHQNLHTLVDICHHYREHSPSKIALKCEHQQADFQQLDEASNQVAQALLAHGITPGARVGLLAKDSINSVEILLACAKIGAVFTPVNWKLAQPEIAYIFADAKTQVLFVDADLKALADEFKSDLTELKSTIVLDDSYQQWRAEYPKAAPEYKAQPEQVVVQMYTSGTTGHPKGVQLPHRSFFAIAKEYAQSDRHWIHHNADDNCMNLLPLFHIGGLWWVVRCLASGAQTTMMPAFIAHQVLKTIEQDAINKTCMVPAMIQFLFSEPSYETTDFSSLKCIIYGGSPIAEALLEKALAAFGCDFLQIYGMTETGNMAVCLPAEAHTTGNKKLLKAVGKAHPGVSLKVVNPQGEQVPTGEIGEILINSPANMLGYWQLPEATASTLIDGWIHTGDAGYFDEEGYLYVCDRIKDMICYAGENVYPAEIESVLFEHPDIAEVAVIGVPDANWGESIKAMVVKKPGTKPSPRSIMLFGKGKLADFKLPKSVDFVESLPRTPAGKLQKAKIRAPFWQNHDRNVN